MCRHKLLTLFFLFFISIKIHAQTGLLNALAFDGINDYVTCPSNSKYNFATGAIECWVKPNLAATYSSIVSNRNSLLSTRFTCYMSSLGIGLSNGSNLQSLLFTSIPGKWYHIAFVCVGANSTNVYVNGELLGNLAVGINTGTTNQALHIGAPYANSLVEYFNGAIDEVRIWNKPISQEQIKRNLYTSIEANDSLVALFHCNQGAANLANVGVNTLLDASATANNGSLVNFSLTAGLTSNWTVSAGLSLFTRPTISGFTPASGPVGTAVTITGTGFNETPANNAVWFGPTKGTVTAATPTSLTVTVPVGATFAPFTVINTFTNLIGYSARPFHTTFPGAALALNAKFDVNQVVAPSCITYADMDGDGKADLIVADQGASQVQIYRNISVNGTLTSGSFAAKATIISGTGIVGVAAGDLDGDGKLDLATAHSGDALVGVYLNTSTVGNLLFDSRISVDLGFLATGRKVDIADIDNDGRPEIIVLTNNGISVIRNFSLLGALSFSIGTGFFIGGVTNDMEIVDLDSDGWKDILVTNNTFSTLSIYKNVSVLGIVSLGIRQDVVIPEVPYKIDAGDLDADGKPDLAITCKNSTLSIYKNTSIPGFISVAAKVSFATGAVSEGIIIGDLDADNKPDIVLSNGVTGQIAVYKNEATAGVITTTSLAAPVLHVASGNPSQTLIADIDGDAKPDLTVMSPSFIAVLKNATQTVLPVELISFTANRNAASIRLDWSTASETNSDRFEIERSADGLTYIKIASVTAAGESMKKIDYTTVDNSPLIGRNIYRLKQIDKDGKIAPSKAVSIDWTTGAKLSVNLAPQPMLQSMKVTVKGGENNSILVLVDMLGKEVKRYRVDGNSTLTISKENLTSGTYLYRLIAPGGKVLDNGKLVVN